MKMHRKLALIDAVGTMIAIGIVCLAIYFVTQSSKESNKSNKPRQCDILREGDTPLRGSICQKAPKGDFVFVELWLSGKHITVHKSRVRWLEDYRFYKNELEEKLKEPYKEQK